MEPRGRDVSRDGAASVWESVNRGCRDKGREGQQVNGAGQGGECSGEWRVPVKECLAGSQAVAFVRRAARSPWQACTGNTRWSGTVQPHLAQGADGRCRLREPSRRQPQLFQTESWARTRQVAGHSHRGAGRGCRSRGDLPSSFGPQAAGPPRALGLSSATHLLGPAGHLPHHLGVTPGTTRERATLMPVRNPEG